MLLRLWGHEVHVCGSAAEALNTALTCLPDVALIDIMLPGMDGLQLARAFREHDELREMALIALTGLGDQEHRRLCGEAGYAAHLLKPLVYRELRKILTALV